MSVIVWLIMFGVCVQALWESKSREAGTPLGKFYSTWRRLRDEQLQAEVLYNLV